MMDGVTGFGGTTPSGVVASLRGPGIYVPTKPASIFAKFVELGYSPIPRYRIDGRIKWPLVWSEFCDRQATEAELAKFAWRYDGVALCGGYGNLLAVDVDTDAPHIKAGVLAALPHCRIGRLGSKGFALLVRYQGERIPNIYPADETCKQPIVEFKGDGANITVPPSLHAKTGKPYIWLNPETGEAIEALPPIEELPILNSADVKRVREALKPYSSVPRQLRASDTSAPVTAAGDRRIAAYFNAGFENETKEIATLKEGRPTALFHGVCRLGWGVHHGFIGKQEFTQGFTKACNSNGLLARDGVRAIEATINSGLERASGDALPVLQDEQPEVQFGIGEGRKLFEGIDSSEPELPEGLGIDPNEVPWEMDGKGKNSRPLHNEHNLRLALQVVGVSVGCNEFQCREEVKGLPNHGPWLDDAGIDALWAYIWRTCDMKYPKGISWRFCWQ